jgi:hypothetical protein
VSLYSAFSSSIIFSFINSCLLSGGKFQTMLLNNLKPSLESPYSGESSRLCYFKIKKPDWKFPDKPGNFRRFAWIFSFLDAKFQSMLCDNYPGRFPPPPPMQIVVLRHALPGPEFSGIIFAVYGVLLHTAICPQYRLRVFITVLHNQMSE